MEDLDTAMEAFPTHDPTAQMPTLEEDPALGLSHRAKMEVLFAVMLGLFLGALDQTIVATALPTIVTQLSGNDYYVWAITIYLLTSTISVPFWGKLSDVYGRKPIFMIGITIFLVGSFSFAHGIKWAKKTVLITSNRQISGIFVHDRA